MPPAFHLLAKPTGAQCNLACRYCYFLSKERLYPGSRFRMDDATLEAYIRQVIEAQAAPEVTLAWQGGEPTLMGLAFFEKAVSLAARYTPPGKTVVHTLQTNGTRLDDDWCRFFHQHHFLVGLSLDGPHALHDAYRVDKSGRGSHAQVMRAAGLLRQHQVDFNILCCVHAANAGQPLKVYRFFRDRLRAEFIQFIPIVERATPQTLPLAEQGWGAAGPGRPLYTQAGDQVTRRSVRPEQWGRFLIAVFDEWVQRDVGQVYVQLFDAALAAWLGQPSPLCIFAETCGSALALEHNGDLYACDHYVEPGYLLGNIHQQRLLDLVSSAKQRQFGLDKRETLPGYCLECEVRFACQGECPRNRFLATPQGQPGLNYLCAGYRAFFNHVDAPMRLMAQLLQAGKPAAEIMRIPGAAWKHPRSRA